MEKYNKTAVIVGGSSGIGCETCARLARKSWNVVNISRTPCKIDKVNNIIADVVAGSTFTDAIKNVGEHNGIDALVYCAGCSMAAPIEYAKESILKESDRRGRAEDSQQNPLVQPHRNTVRIGQGEPVGHIIQSTAPVASGPSNPAGVKAQPQNHVVL